MNLNKKVVLLILAALSFGFMATLAKEPKHPQMLSFVRSCMDEKSGRAIMMYEPIFGSTRATLINGETVELMRNEGDFDFGAEGGYDAYTWRDAKGIKRHFFIIYDDVELGAFGFWIEQDGPSAKDNVDLFNRLDAFNDCQKSFVWLSPLTSAEPQTDTEYTKTPRYR